MKATDSDREQQTAVLARLLAVPAERDLPAGREQALREHLLSELRPAGRPSPDRGRRRAGRSALVAGAVAGAVAVAAVIVAGHSGPAQLAPKTAAPGSSGIPSPAAAASAAQLVAYATRAAAAEPAIDPGPHEWIYTDILQAASSAGVGGYLFGPPNERVDEQSWVRVDHLRFAYLRHGKLVFSGGDLPRPRGGSLPAPQLLPLGWPSIGYPYLNSLPARPAQLTAVIEANLRSQGLSPGASSQTIGVSVFNAIQALMLNMVLPPRLLAGLYGVLATDRAVRFDPSVTDLAGRTGVGFYTVQDGYFKPEIVINPRTYAYMGYLDTAVRAHTEAGTDGTVHFRKGQVLGWEAMLASGIVQRPGQIP